MYDTISTSEKIKRSLVEWHEFTLPPLVPRSFDDATLKNRRIVSIIGPRRAGKTYACFEMIGDLLKKGIPRENCIYINFEDERLVPLTGTELTHLLDAHEEIYRHAPEKPLYCFLDEVHNVPNWSKWVRRVIDQNVNLSVVLTGSSSKMLSTEIATELRGRGSSVMVFPYSFREFLNARRVDVEFSEKLLYSSRRAMIKRYFNDYSIKGGFPEIANHEEYRDILQRYFRTMFARDMVERFKIRNIRQFEDFLKIQLSRFASLSSISNSEKEMKAIGYSLSKNTLMTYLGYARDVFLLFDVCKFDFKVTRQLRAPRKLYAIDHGLLNAVRFSVSEDKGRILENIAFLELRRRYGEIYYHAENAECDFIIRSGRRITRCFQVCWSIEQKDTLEREIKGLMEAMTAHRLKEGMILTNDEQAEFEREGKKIIVRPLWHFALEGKKDQDG
jgi:predicted AAA+ superfamily ATPase